MCPAIKSEKAVLKNGRVCANIRENKILMFSLRTPSSTTVGSNDFATMLAGGRHDGGFSLGKLLTFIKLLTA